jgi:hypothetical protein
VQEAATLNATGNKLTEDEALALVEAVRQELVAERNQIRWFSRCRNYC